MAKVSICFYHRLNITYFCVFNPTTVQAHQLKECTALISLIRCKDVNDCVPICKKKYPTATFPKSCMGGGSVCICAYNSSKCEN
ncbi:hypothetical protein P3S67_026635 [Capsicum chacoense]